MIEWLTAPSNDPVWVTLVLVAVLVCALCVAVHRIGALQRERDDARAEAERLHSSAGDRAFMLRTAMHMEDRR